MALTSNPNDPRLTHGLDTEPTPQAPVYLVFTPTEKESEFVRPVRTSYEHIVCGAITTINMTIAETYARKPHFYGATYCTGCRMHRPVGEDGEFIWPDGTKVGS